MYRFVLPDEMRIETGLRIQSHLVMRDEQDKLWGMLMPDGVLMVEKGYAWNGASPVLQVGNQLIAPPMGGLITDPLTKQYVPKLYIPTLVHDLFCQFKDQLPEAGLTLLDIDQEFLHQSRQYQFSAAGLYYRGIRLWSAVRYRFWPRLHAAMKRIVEDGRCK